MSFVLTILSLSPSMQAVMTFAPLRAKQTIKLDIWSSQEPLAIGMSTRFVMVNFIVVSGSNLSPTVRQLHVHRPGNLLKVTFYSGMKKAKFLIT
jgi:hypothetical protein